MINGHTNTKPVGEVLNDFKEEFKDFANTRLQMLRNEANEKMTSYKAALPMIIIGACLLVLALLLLTGMLVSLVAMAFIGKPWAYVVAFAIVGVVYGLGGAVAALTGYKKLKATGLAPERTIHVLKQDSDWFKQEARSA